MANATISGPITIGPSSIGNDHLQTNILDPIDADKMQHIHKVGTNFALAIGATPVAREEVIFRASTAGRVRRVAALLNDSGTATNVNFDLKKNGVSVLSAAINVVHGTGDRVEVAGTISSPTFVAGDVFSLSLAVTGSTGAQGPFAYAEFEEVAA